MKNRILVVITLLSAAGAAGGIYFGIVAAYQRDRMQEEMLALRNQPIAPDTQSYHETAGEEPLSVSSNRAAGTGTSEVTALRKQLAERDTELVQLRNELSSRPDTSRHESFQERMARMKEEEPERYAEMIKSRTEHKEQMRYSQANRLATLMDVDTGSMTPDELANHNLLLEKLTGLWELTDNYDPSLPPDRETMHQMFSTVREVGDMMEMERSVMLKQLGYKVGLSNSEAEDFASYAESIFSATTLRSPRGSRGSSGSI
jgi:hypothetical protein